MNNFRLSLVKVRELAFRLMTDPFMPPFKKLPKTPPVEGAASIFWEEGVPILRASRIVQVRIQELLEKERGHLLSEAEKYELDGYEELDDYLSFVNRVVRNLSLDNPKQD
jgi:hypothetical protein